MLSPAFWERALAFVAQEKAQAERVGRTTPLFFKSIFRHFGPAALEAMKAPLEKLCRNTSERSSQRAAAEVLAGLLRGCKQWCAPATR